MEVYIPETPDPIMMEEANGQYSIVELIVGNGFV
jgi:hypothetical protein